MGFANKWFKLTQNLFMQKSTKILLICVNRFYVNLKFKPLIYDINVIIFHLISHIKSLLSLNTSPIEQICSCFDRDRRSS